MTVRKAKSGSGSLAARAKAQPSAAKPAPSASAEPAKPVAAVVAAAAPIIETAQAVVTSATDRVASTVNKEDMIMTTKIEAPKMFADMNDRAKAAMEKSTKMVEEMNDFAKGNLEAMVESGKIAAKGLETLGQDAADYGRKSFETMTSAFKGFASVKSPTEFFKLQSDYMRSAFDSAVAQSSKNTEAMIKLAGDAAQPISNRVALAADKVKVAA